MFYMPWTMGKFKITNDGWLTLFSKDLYPKKKKTTAEQGYFARSPLERQGDECCPQLELPLRRQEHHRQITRLCSQSGRAELKSRLEHQY